MTTWVLSWWWLQVGEWVCRGLILCSDILISGTQKMNKDTLNADNNRRQQTVKINLWLYRFCWLCCKQMAPVFLLVSHNPSPTQWHSIHRWHLKSFSRWPHWLSPHITGPVTQEVGWGGVNCHWWCSRLCWFCTALKTGVRSWAHVGKQAGYSE